jgi:hypothetical protein
MTARAPSAIVLHMAKKPKPKADKQPEPKNSERDEPVKIELDPEVALRALLKVEPDAEAAPLAKTHRQER